jgi:hypothetical protein
MTKENIKEINSNCPINQGIFVEPSMIPIHIKEPVIYCRYETGGYRGGNCYDSKSKPYTEEPPKDRFKVLEMVLEKLKPNITFLQYKKIERLIYNNEETEYEYYGNSTDWKVEYIILSDLEKLLSEL